jgi:hypothetical protein
MRTVSSKIKKKLVNLMNLFDKKATEPVACFIDFKPWFATPVKKVMSGSIHSEVILCNRFPNTNKDVFVFRENYKCTKSCNHCIHFMKTRGIKRVYYTDGVDIACDDVTSNDYISSFYIFLKLKNKKDCCLQLHHNRRLHTLPQTDVQLYEKLFLEIKSVLYKNLYKM